MAMTRKRIVVTTAADGTFHTEAHMQGALRAVAVDLGSGPTALSTPDLSITDTYDDSVMLAKSGIASNTTFYPQIAGNDAADGSASDGFVSPIAVQKIAVDVAGGGDTKSGTIYLFVER